MLEVNNYNQSFCCCRIMAIFPHGINTVTHLSEKKATKSLYQRNIVKNFTERKSKQLGPPKALYFVKLICKISRSFCSAKHRSAVTANFLTYYQTTFFDLKSGKSSQHTLFHHSLMFIVKISNPLNLLDMCESHFLVSNRNFGKVQQLDEQDTWAITGGYKKIIFRFVFCFRFWAGETFCTAKQ